VHEIDYSQRFPIIKLEFSSEISGISFPKNLTRKRYVIQKNCRGFLWLCGDTVFITNRQNVIRHFHYLLFF